MLIAQQEAEEKNLFFQWESVCVIRTQLGQRELSFWPSHALQNSKKVFPCHGGSWEKNWEHSSANCAARKLLVLFSDVTCGG